MPMIIPKQITVASGAQRGDWLIIIGTTPIAAAMEVRNIGLILRLPACMAASLYDMPRLFTSSNA